MSYENLDIAGRILVQQVRDRTLMIINDAAAGKYKTSALMRMAEHGDALGVEAVQQIARTAVDYALHALMMCCEEGPLRLYLVTKEGARDVAGMSEELPHELLGPDGWIGRYSKFERTEEE